MAAPHGSPALGEKGGVGVFKDRTEYCIKKRGGLQAYVRVGGGEKAFEGKARTAGKVVFSVLIPRRSALHHTLHHPLLPAIPFISHSASLDFPLPYPRMSLENLF